MLAPKDRRTKKGRPNPYAERGLDHFALVSAELQAAREKLVAQLGTSLSLVRFESGPDDRKWIPIIVSQTSSKDEMRALRRAISGLVTRNEFADTVGHQIVLDSGNQSARETMNSGTECSDMSMHARSIVPDITENTHTGSKVEEMCDESSSGHDSTLAGSTEAHERAIVYCMKVITQGLLWLVNFIVFCGSTVTITALGEHAVEELVRRLPFKSTLNKESVTVDDHLEEMTPSLEPSALLQSLRVVASTTTGKPSSTLSSSPSTPRASLQSMEPSKTSKTPHYHGLTHHVLEIEGNNLIRKAPTNRVLRSSTSRPSMKTLADKNAPHRLGQALTLTGLVFILSGLVMGYYPAIVGVVCWWYVLPSMRHAVGDKPFVRPHHHHHQSSLEHENIAAKDIRTRGRDVASSLSSAKDDMGSYEYKKKVVKDGLLERRRHTSHV